MRRDRRLGLAAGARDPAQKSRLVRGRGWSPAWRSLGPANAGGHGGHDRWPVGPGGPVRDGTRRHRSHHDAGYADRPAASHRRRARRAALSIGAVDQRLHPAGARRGQTRVGEDRDLDPRRPRPPLHRRALPRQPGQPHRRQRHAPRRPQHRPERQPEHRHRLVLRPAQRLRVPRQRRRRHGRRPDHRRARRQPRLEHGVAVPREAGCGRLDRGDGVSVPVAAVSARRHAGVGPQHPPHDPLEERVRLSQPGATDAGRARDSETVVGGHAGGPGSAAQGPEPGHQALRARRGQGRPRRGPRASRPIWTATPAWT